MFKKPIFWIILIIVVAVLWFIFMRPKNSVKPVGQHRAANQTILSQSTPQPMPSDQGTNGGTTSEPINPDSGPAATQPTPEMYKVPSTEPRRQDLTDPEVSQGGPPRSVPTTPPPNTPPPSAAPEPAPSTAPEASPQNSTTPQTMTPSTTTPPTNGSTTPAPGNNNGSANTDNVIDNNSTNTPKQESQVLNPNPDKYNSDPTTGSNDGN